MAGIEWSVTNKSSNHGGDYAVEIMMGKDCGYLSADEVRRMARIVEARWPEKKSDPPPVSNARSVAEFEAEWADGWQVSFQKFIDIDDARRIVFQVIDTGPNGNVSVQISFHNGEAKIRADNLFAEFADLEVASACIDEIRKAIGDPDA